MMAFFQEFFRGGGKMYCYANFFVMLIFLLFSDQISGEAKSPRGLRGGARKKESQYSGL